MPARPTWYVGRAGISAALDRPAWLTTVVAGAGAGKTIAIGAWAVSRPVIWLGLTAADAELPVFVSKLRDAAKTAALLGQPAIETLRAATGPAGDNDYADSLASLLAAAATIDTGDDTDPEMIPTVVMDGFDAIPAASATARFVEALSRHAPNGFRLLLASRTPIPFPIDRLRDNGRLSELTSADLVFDVDETYQLLTIALGDAAAADEIASDLHTLAAGWPSQISLGAAWLGQMPPEARKRRLASFDVFDGQLNEAILTSAMPMIRALVRVAACLPRVNASLLTDLGCDCDDDRLSMCAPMLMPEPGRPGWRRVSAAAKAAVAAADPLSVSERRALQRAAGMWFSQHGELDSAIATAIDLADPDFAADLLERHGADLIAAGRAGEVVAAVDIIPAAARSSGVRLVEGEARFARGDVDGALACIGDVVPATGAVAASVARRVGKVRQLAGDIAGAADVYERARRDGADPVDMAILLGQLATVHWLRGDLENARPVAKTAIAHAEECGDPRALASAYAAAAMVSERDGDLERSEECTRRAATAAQECGDLMQLARVRVNRGQRLVQQARYAEALVELDTALRLTELTGSGGWFGAVTRTNRGWAYRGLGRHAEALAELGAAYEYWHGSHSDLVAYAQIARGAVCLDNGDLERAESELSAALVVGERSGDHQALNGLTTHARVRYATDPESAWQMAERAQETNIGHWRHWAPLTMAWLALCDGDPKAALGHVDRARESMERYRDAFAVAEATELRALASDDDTIAVKLLIDAGRQWGRLGNPVFVSRVGVVLACRTGHQIAAAQARLLALGVRPSAALAAGPLRVAGAFSSAIRPDCSRFISAARQALAGAGAPGGSQALIDVLALLPSAPDRTKEVRRRHIEVMRALAAASSHAGDADAALAWHLRLLEESPYDEASHLGVVTMLAATGRHSEARRRYRMYTDRMRQRNREPAPYPV